jgi:hypothetical protein
MTFPDSPTIIVLIPHNVKNLQAAQYVYYNYAFQSQGNNYRMALGTAVPIVKRT